jgi:hypothetical protein
MAMAIFFQAMQFADDLKEMIENMKDVSPDDMVKIRARYKEAGVKHGRIWIKGDHLKEDV